MLPKYEILYGDTFPVLRYRLDAGETIKAESDAMVAMSPTVDVEGKLEGGILGGLGRLFSGESFFFQTMNAKRGPGEVILAPPAPGSIMALGLDGSREYSVQKGGFLAATPGIQVGTRAQNIAKGLFSKLGFFILKMSGTGTVFLNALGCIHNFILNPGEEIIVDNGHLVAWPTDMRYTLRKATKGLVSMVTSGEGLVCRFEGPGQIFIQTRNPTAYAAWTRSILPKW
ncbi:MAG: TIGR00266 family protein [Deltaproteobacteria bacterium]|jgi:uncharacterized protein (TIGR00266 family)|nr:TIGR00266 family protein [Deltaproteobacteria bacterium]